MKAEKYLEILLRQVEGMINFALVAIAAALVAFFMAPGWRNKFHYIGPSIILGCVLGFGAQELTGLYGIGIVVAAIATITAPATIAALEGKTIQELVELIRDVTKGKKKDGD